MLKEFLVFLVLNALNADGMPRVAGVNLQSEATSMRTKSQGF